MKRAVIKEFTNGDVTLNFFCPILEEDKEITFFTSGQTVLYIDSTNGNVDYNNGKQVFEKYGYALTCKESEDLIKIIRKHCKYLKDLSLSY